jgi:hypothetical protein
MTSFQGQEIAAFAMVALAGLSVGRRIVGQVAAFRGPSKSGRACDGCGPGGPAGGREAKLVQIQTRPPLRVRRPGSNE